MTWSNAIVNQDRNVVVATMYGGMNACLLCNADDHDYYIDFRATFLYSIDYNLRNTTSSVLYDAINARLRTDPPLQPLPEVPSGGRGRPWEPGAASVPRSSGPNHNVPSPPTRDTRSRRRPPARRANNAESVLRRLQIMGSAARRHLFAHVEFDTYGPSIALWIAVFPDPLNSPAHHTRNLAVTGLRSVADTDNDAIPWIRAFHNVVHLDVKTLGWILNYSADYRPPSGRSTWRPPRPDPLQSSALYIPFPFSRISP